MTNQTAKKDIGWVKSTLEPLLRSVDHDYIKSCRISIVPEGLKESNEDAAYLPRVVSMGPRFKGSSSSSSSSREEEYLVRMEKVKLRCMWSLFHRVGDSEVHKKMTECSEAIFNSDDQVRASYEADIKLERHELADIMLVDGCFLLELLISKGMDAELPSRLFPPGPAPQVLKDQLVLSDLMLLENQIPILVLHKLSRILFPHIFEEDPQERATRINNLALSVFGYSLPDHVPITEVPVHVLDVVHCFVHGKTCCRNGEVKVVVGDHVVVDIPDTVEQNPMLKLERCAWRLQAAGVTIKLREDTITDTDSPAGFTWLRKKWNCCVGSTISSMKQVDIAAATEKKMRGLDMQFEFKEGKLEIKQLHITETTKVMWRNFIAWEHHKRNSERYFGFREEVRISRGKFTTAALIFSGLICCPADVRLLKDKNIIVDHVKYRSNEELAAFLGTLSFGVDPGVVDLEYVKMIGDLNNYSDSCFISRSYRLAPHFFHKLVRFMERDYNFVQSVAALVGVVTSVQAYMAMMDYFRS